MAEQIKSVNEAEGLELGSVSRDIMLRKLYETFYGIHDHYNGKAKPFDLYKARQKEETFLYSKRAVDIQRFMDLGVHSLTGMGMSEFFSQPYHEVEYIFALAERSTKRENTQTEKLERELREALGATKGNQ